MYSLTGPIRMAHKGFFIDVKRSYEAKRLGDKIYVKIGNSWYDNPDCIFYDMSAENVSLLAHDVAKACFTDVLHNPNASGTIFIPLSDKAMEDFFCHVTKRIMSYKSLLRNFKKLSNGKVNQVNLELKRMVDVFDRCNS